jgi:hypothetical protein
LESSWRALSGGTISFFIPTNLHEGGLFSEFF